ncbi:hypothetical protein HUX88_31055 [Duganella sp. BJB1802]|uniref:hypothetical protein n=1 Tax=Duganella sp. BJB1802 TaxID=2744575 RepID=UPI0015944A4A|nr:hypothetical protein [Duganella sp. BJB1802]NVD74923.1 hypothetical protein [Duganella sp. BJB1802]
MENIVFRLKVLVGLCWAFFAVCGLLILHYLALKLFTAHHWTPPASGDWATWFGSVGSIGAFGAAIWLATEQNRQKRRESFTAARLTAANVYFQVVHNDAYCESALKMLAMLAGRKLPFDMTPTRVLTTIQFAQQTLREFKSLTPAELASLAVLPNDVAVHLAAAQGRVTSTIALLKQIEDRVSDHDEMNKQLLLNIQVLAVAQHALSEGRQAIGRLVDLEGIQPPP